MPHAAKKKRHEMTPLQIQKTGSAIKNLEDDRKKGDHIRGSLAEPENLDHVPDLYTLEFPVVPSLQWFF